MADFYGVFKGGTIGKSWITVLTANQYRLPISLVAAGLNLLVWLAIFPAALFAQNINDYTIEVLVADQGQKQRNNAYWLAFDRVLRRDIPDAIIEPEQRSKLLREASRYVQSFRYRRFDPSLDVDILTTRSVREGAEADSVIVVNFPADLENIVRQQAGPASVIEIDETVSQADILALVAVDQQDNQFLIGGSRGRKFQSRMRQLGSANALSFQFPSLDSADQELINPTDVLFNQTDRLEGIAARYETNRRLSASLFRLSEEVWQTEWRYVVAGEVVQTLNLTTRSLDEALVTALSELGGSGAGYRVDSYVGQSKVFQRDGVGLRVENLTSIGDYRTLLTVLQRVEPSFVTESLEAGAVVFRASEATVFDLQQSLARLPQLSLLSGGATGTAGPELIARFVGQ